MKPRGHIPVLDGLRGLAILMVLVCHLFQACHVQLVLASPWIGGVAAKLAQAGWRGVDLFFVLSGFLITGILYDAQSGQHFFRNFYMRRFLRIFPLYYGVLAIVLFLIPALLSFNSPALQNILAHQAWLWLYGANVPPASHLNWLDCEVFNLTHLWSLAVEEHFYLVWPLVVFLLGRRALIGVCSSIILVAPVLRAVLLFSGMNYWTIYSFTPFRLDSLAMGALAAVLARGEERLSLSRWATRGAAVFGFLCLCIIAIRRTGEAASLAVKAVDFTFSAAFFGCFLWLVVEALPGSRVSRLFVSPIMRSLGKYSYGLYVLHCALMPCFLYFISPKALATLTHSPLIGATLFIVLGFWGSFGAAFVSWHLYEKQFLKLKRFFDYHKGPAISHETQAQTTGIGTGLQAVTEK